MKTYAGILTILIAGALCTPAGARGAKETAPNLYVPYGDIGDVIDPAGKAVLMDRAAFAKLLTAARKSDTGALELGQITTASYTVEVRGGKVSISGELTVVSMSDRPVAVPLKFSRIALTKVSLDAEPAPLGFDKQGRVVLIVTGRRAHTLHIAGSSFLRELPGGGMELSVGIPPAVAGSMTLSADGDVSVHSTAPVRSTAYDKKTDRTTVELTIGGRGAVTALMLGNGREEDDRPILLGQSVTSVKLSKGQQIFTCLYTVQILRRGARELQFALPGGWTVTGVTSPNLIRWSVEDAEGGEQRLSARLRQVGRGTQVLHVHASAAHSGMRWEAPYVRLIGAAFQRGHVVVDTGDTLRVRGEKLTDARREDAVVAADLGAETAAGGRAYYHWGERWGVALDLTDVRLRRGSEERQTVTISPDGLWLVGRFQVTAIGREMFDIAFVLPPKNLGWTLDSLTVGGKREGFQYRISDRPEGRELRIDLAAPLRVESVAEIVVSLRRVPADWRFAEQIARARGIDASPRTVAVPLIRSRTDTVSGVLSVLTAGDLDATPIRAPAQLKPVTVGRMASLGLSNAVQTAYSYEADVADSVQLSVRRRAPRLAADSVGLITASPTKLAGDWLIHYRISRASVKTLYFLADKTLGNKLDVAARSRRIVTHHIVAPGEKTVEVGEQLSGRYDLWEVTLDAKAAGTVTLSVHYDRPLPPGRFDAPLIRPAGVDQSDEVLAVQASEDLAVTVETTAAEEIDAVDLPPLAIRATRVLAAHRIEAATTAAGAGAAITLSTKVHEGYPIASALVSSARLTTYLGPDGAQRCDATFRIVNAGLQFLPIRLPDGAQLWSLSVSGTQAKPKRDSAGNYLVALPRSDEPVPVRVVYAVGAAAGGIARTELAPATPVGVQVNRLQWEVVPPTGYTITSQETNLQSVGVHRPIPAYERIRDYLPSLFGWRGVSLGDRLEYAYVMESRAIAPRERLVDATDGAFVEHQERRARGAKKAEDLEMSRRAMEEEMRFAEEMARRMPRRREGRTRRDDRRMHLRLSLSTSDLEPKAPTTQPVAKPAQPSAGQVVRLGKRAMVGRYTLPVTLVTPPDGGPSVTFTSLGEAKVVVGVTSNTAMCGWWWFGFVLVAVVGLALVRSGAAMKAIFAAGVLTASSLLATWWIAATYFANGAFVAAASLVAFYLLIGIGRWGKRTIDRQSKWTSAAPAALLLAVCAFSSTAHAAQRPSQAEPAKGGPSATPLIIPYEGDPTQADQSRKVLVPYAEFVRLWNLAHPDDQMDAPRAAARVALADVRYEAVVTAPTAERNARMDIVLTAQVRTLGKGAVSLPVPMSGVAIVEATFDGAPAQLRVGPRGQVLMLRGGADGKLRIAAVATPRYLGRMGRLKLQLPPLPAAVMTVHLPDDDLVLEAPGAEGAPIRGEGEQRSVWTVALGSRRDLSLRWSPAAGGGAADRTLSAAATHDVYIFHWATVGMSKFRYTFSAGEHDRFAMLLPATLTLTGVSGPNVRDHRPAGSRTLDGTEYRLIEVRLHRPAKTNQELTLRWMGELPPLGRPGRLALPRTSGVGRESGTVSLRAGGGMTVKVTNVTGGRRSAVAGGGPGVHRAPEAGREVGRYYWPYRPFSIFVKLSREDVRPAGELRQLVRIAPDSVQLLVDASLRTDRGRAFGVSFALPDGYELLSAIGPAVGDHYIQPTPTGRRLHVNFSGPVTGTSLALVLVRKGAELDRLNVPTVTMIDHAGVPLPAQKGKLAVQVAPALSAHTLSSENLRPVAPGAIRAWLKGGQSRAVQFAYEYDRPTVALRLAVVRRASRVRVEVFAGVSIRPTAASYTYRLRYNIDGFPIDRVSFTLPKRYAPLVAVACPSMRRLTQTDEPDGTTRWTVALVEEVTGVLDVTVNFALPIDPDTRILSVPPPRTDAPAGYRAILAVQNFSRHELSVVGSAKLDPLAPSEQKAILSGEVREWLQYVYQSFSPGWSLSLGLKPAPRASRVQAVVDLLAITTTIDRSGNCRYHLALTLQNRREQFLALRVPDGLKLWSAHVAGQPVKPVTDPARDPNLVLIPLVKTSPGGLPYDVTIYLGGKLAHGIEGVGTLSPPPIRIEGIPVMRTTWSLRLPAGFDYRLSGGNVSSAAGTAELMSIAIDARLDQLKRLDKTYRELGGGYSVGGRVARGNWDRFNVKLGGEISQAREYIESNRDLISADDYSRLTRQLGYQRTAQSGMVEGWNKRQETERLQGSNSINRAINADAANPGRSEMVRNELLVQVPDFVRRAESGQRKMLQKELAESAERAKSLRARSRRGGPRIRITSGKSGDRLIIAADEKEAKAEVDKLLSQLEAKQADEELSRQSRLKDQLANLADNRMQRFYGQQGTGGGGFAGERGRSRADRRAPRPTAPPQRTSSGGPVARVETYWSEVPAGTQFRVWDTTVAQAGALQWDTYVTPDSIPRPLAGYIARGTFSLPVELPAGEVTLDFSSPGGEAELTLRVIPSLYIRNAWTSAVVVGALVVFSLIAWCIRRAVGRGYTLRPLLGLLYVAIAAVLALVLGMLGIALAILLILVAELLRSRRSRRRTAPSAA